MIEEASGSKSTPVSRAHLQRVSDTNNFQNAYILNAASFETPTRRAPHSRTPVFKAPQTPSRFPKTPTNRHVYSHEPSSSRASSPVSSPARIVNLVSSPGPMRTDPPDEDEDDLPYTLPPGPYSREKPDLSYAALIGQAILSSPEHRLALQDIYEWITTVYPHYQRGEQTWMNSVRHALSTMAVFRKVPRARMGEGKSSWAIYDQDLPCFSGGGFRKSLCADMVKVKAEGSKHGSKKRGVMEEAMSRNAKRRKTGVVEHDVYGNPVPPLVSAPILQPFYSHVLPGSNHQPYYGTYMANPQGLPAEVVFPPLPLSSNYHQLAAMKVANASSSSRATSVDASSSAPSVSTSSHDGPPSSHEASPVPSSLIASSSVPELSPDDGSSSSPALPEALPETMEIKTEPIADTLQALVEPAIADPDADFEKWLAIDDAVAPHMTLLGGFTEAKASPERLHITPTRKRTGKVCLVCAQKLLVLKSFVTQMPALPVPTSPTIERRTAAKQKAATAKPSTTTLAALVSQRSSSSRDMLRPSTPPPRTPPRKPLTRLSPQSSPKRTPVSYSRARKSPSPQHDVPTLPSELLRTPSRKRVTSDGGGGGSGSGKKSPGAALFSFSPFAPVTPKRSLFGSGGGGDWGSPYRTPQSLRRLFDPHDPATMLDDELNRLNSLNGPQESTSGLYGRAGRGLLYESPLAPSPSQWGQAWQD